MFYGVLECVEVIEVDSGGENCRNFSKIDEILSKSMKILKIQAKSRFRIENHKISSSSPERSPGECPEPSHRFIMLLQLH